MLSVSSSMRARPRSANSRAWIETARFRDFWGRAKVVKMTRADAAPTIWLQLLQYQRARGRTGLTIPFLVGAVAVPIAPEAMEENAAYAALSSLLLSLRDATPEGHSVVIAE